MPKQAFQRLAKDSGFIKGRPPANHTPFAPLHVGGPGGFSDFDASIQTARTMGHSFGDISVTAGQAAVQAKMGSAIQRDEGQLTTSGGGNSLPGEVANKMSGAFGQDFSDVRIHEGDTASSIGALAFTQGNDIHFAPGQYNPNSSSGQQLLGHELTHVVQQRAGQVSVPQGKGLPINSENHLEAEADTLGARAANGQQVSVKGAGSIQNFGEGASIQRKSAKPVQRMGEPDMDEEEMV